MEAHVASVFSFYFILESILELSLEVLSWRLAWSIRDDFTLISRLSRVLRIYLKASGGA